MNKKKFFLSLPFITASLLVGCSKNNCQTSSTTNNSSIINQTSDETSSSQTSSSEEAHEPVVYYTSPTAKATGKGTKEDPLEVYVAVTLLKAGDTLIFLNGTYDTPARIFIEAGQNGKEGAPITLKAETDGKVILDFKQMIFGSNNRGLQIASDWWVVRGLVIRKAGDNGIYIGGSHNLVDRCEVYQCMDSGIQIGRKASTDQQIADWPSYNTILNCTSHDNSDPTGEDADGFACKLTTGVGNVFKGCIAYNNIDDGWDLYSKADTGPIGPVTLEDCVAFNNGVDSKGHGLPSSDGNGFKLGGEQIAVPHVVKNCIAFNNLAHGFTDNSNPGTLRLENCTSFNNSIREADCNNIDVNRENVTSNGNYLKNILSFSTGNYDTVYPYEKESANSYDHYYGAADHCAFYYGLTSFYIEGPEKCDYSNELYRGNPITLSTSPFVSTVAPKTGANEKGEFDYNFLRNEDFDIDLGDFLKVRADSEFATMGTDNSCLGANLHGRRGN